MTLFGVLNFPVYNTFDLFFNLCVTLSQITIFYKNMVCIRGVGAGGKMKDRKAGKEMFMEEKEGSLTS